MNVYANFSSAEGLALLENHLESKLRQQEEEEARKILDLEEDLAGLNLDRSFTAASVQTTSTTTTDHDSNKDPTLLDIQNGNNLVSQSLTLNVSLALVATSTPKIMCQHRMAAVV